MSVKAKSKQIDKRHGGAYDRGSADAYYSRPADPHMYVGATYTSERIALKRGSVGYAEYLCGYLEQTDRKEWD